jgi:acyl carrier protein
LKEAEIRQKLRDWIVDRAKEKPDEMADDTPILERGILSSLDVVELILFIERIKGDEVDMEKIQPETIRDVDSIYQAFFGA